MFIRNRWIATGAVSVCLLQGLKYPLPAASALPSQGLIRATPPVRKLFSPPTQKLVSRQLQAGFVHVYPLPLKAGERVEIIADQDGVDLRAALFDPTGQYLFTVDNPTGTKGPERIVWVAEVSGQHRIEIYCSENSSPGLYRIWVKDEGPATATDKEDALAERLYYQAAEKQKQRALDQAEEALQRAVMLWEKNGNQGRQADALNLLGSVYHDKWAWKESLKSFRQARLLYLKLRRTSDEGRVDNNIGVIQERLFDLASAQESYRQALACGERSQDRSVIATAHENLGSILRRKGRAEEALDNFEHAQKEWEGLNPEKEAEILTHMGGVFVTAGRWVQAQEKYREALAVSKASKNLRAKALALEGMGSLYLKTNEPEKALCSYQEALAIQQQAGLLDSIPNSLNGLAEAFLNEKKPQEALAPFRKALSIFEKQTDLRSQARVWVNLGWTYARLHHERDARTAYERALRIAKGLDSWTAAGAMLGLARLEQASGNPIAAQRQAEAAVKRVEDLRTAVGPGFRISFFATKQDIYDALIEVLLWEHSLKPAAGYDAEALRVSEQARSRGLLDRVAAARLTTRSEPSFSSAPILSLSEIQALLDPDTLVLEYHLGRQASYLWIVGSSFHHLVKLPPREQLESLITRASQLLQVSQRREKAWAARHAAMDLSRTLLAPALPWLGRKRLLISAPEALQSVSFVALPDPSVQDPPGSKVWPKPMLIEHEIIRIPSVSVSEAIHARAAHRTPPQDLLAFLGDSVTDDRDERLAGIPGFSPRDRSKKASEGFSLHFDRLKSTEAEGNAILKEAGRRNVMGAFGFAATRELVTSGQLSTFRIIHFATHGLARPDDANHSALVLSMWDRQGHPIDGFLQAADIYGLHLPANLVVLSACDTGLGERIPGEGVVGLSQAFMGAGATRVLVSLWPVEDGATSRLMKDFYHEYLGKGLSPALALRNAQAAMWKDPNHNAPFYWGGFEIQGDWQSVRDPR